MTIKYKLREQEIIKNDQVELKTEFFKTENLIVELKQPMGHPCGNEHTKLTRSCFLRIIPIERNQGFLEK